VIFREPVFLPGSGRTYERRFLQEFWKKSGEIRDPITNNIIDSTKTYTNWDVRRQVHQFLDDAFPLYTPVGWPGGQNNATAARCTVRIKIDTARQDAGSGDALGNTENQ
jgi:hypothetical protein